MGVEVFSKEFKESDWENYLNYSRKLFDTLTDEIKNVLDDVDIPHGIKNVAVGRLNSYAKEWLFSSLSVLDDRKPADLLNSDEGTRAVKEALLRMPD